MRSPSSLVALLSFLAGAALGADPDCQQLPQAAKDQEDRYWKVYMGQIPGDHLVEGEKLDELTAKLRNCPPPGKSAPKPAPSTTPAASASVAPAVPSPNLAAAAPAPGGTPATSAAMVATATSPTSGVVSAPASTLGAVSTGVPAATAAPAASAAPVAVVAAVPNAAASTAAPQPKPAGLKPVDTQSGAALDTPLRQEPPADEGAFCTIVRDFAQQYQSLSATAGNEPRLAELRWARAEALRQSLGTTRVTNWTATLTRPRTTGDGHAVVEVRLPCGAILKTWNTTNSDVGSDTLIAHGSPLFVEVGKLREDQQVVVEGQLFQGARDGFTELSLSERGSMLNPEFLFRFANIRPE